MKWIYAIPQKFKITCILGSIIFCITLFTLLESRNVNNINRSVISIYTDRLIPATDIFFLAEHFYAKRTKLEGYLKSNPSSAANINAQLKHHNAKIEILINKFEKTYLVEEESVLFTSLKSSLDTYAALESQIVTQSLLTGIPTSIKILEARAFPMHDQAIRQLSQLTKIQSTVGTALLNKVKNDTAKSDLISNLQLIVCIVTGVLIVAIIFAAKITSGREEKFKLN